MQKFLFLGDFCLIFVAFVLATEQTFKQAQNLDNISVGIMFAVVMQVTFLGLGLYKSKLREKLLGLTRRLFIATAISYLLLSIMVQFIENHVVNSESIFYACVYSLLASAIFRFLLIRNNVLGFARRNVVVLGCGQRALIIEERMRRDVDKEGFNLLGFVHMEGDIPADIKENHIVVLKNGLVEFVIKNHVHEIVVATDERRENLPVDDLFSCKLRGVVVTEILDFIEKETGQIAVNLIYPSWVIYSDGFVPSNDIRNTFDWLFNAALSTILFLVAWPFMLLTVIAIKLEDGLDKPCFYKQERVGLRGNIFQIIKFRSMKLDAENNGAQWAKTSDSRITKVGSIIRKYRIDELPQIYNVLAGDMGFVGPRPERPEFVEQLRTKIPYYNERHNVKSGLTGWAQLKYPYGATVMDAEEKLKFDLYYIKHRSFFLDLSIIIQTFEVILFGKGR
ncbi:TIGR03013 family PEP-CTERM/XrtA system glycosyltransferase [Thalassotalea psychrophila]|uniref:TIGR03013 family PEP-CTERM/XrtA system glycosyltransferase n=1 Tax=Thalassotalea psychrophila TaxID=3065647 RepID=A0ABY9TUL1_9GAMM|nr:TIGR03013 family PEP-CTERM/XrtA system glycosyltransferase [Colwelliaceae bacterium SQ149]